MFHLTQPLLSLQEHLHWSHSLKDILSVVPALQDILIFKVRAFLFLLPSKTKFFLLLKKKSIYLCQLHGTKNYLLSSPLQETYHVIKISHTLKTYLPSEFRNSHGAKKYTRQTLHNKNAPTHFYSSTHFTSTDKCLAMTPHSVLNY